MNEKSRKNDPYAALGLAPGASRNAIKRAFRDLARRLHPDVNASPEAEAQMRSINAANALLTDPTDRAVYDAAAHHRASSQYPSTVDNKATQGATNAMYRNESLRHNTDLTFRAGDEGPRRGGEVSIALPVVPQSFHQLGLFVLDGSGSMAEEVTPGVRKADATNGALRDLFTRFKVSSKKANFSFAAVAFDEDADTLLAVTPTAEVDDNADYDPMARRGGCTFIGSGLEAAERIASDFLMSVRADIPASVVMVVMSDGICGDPARTLAIANRVKRMERVRVCTTHLAPVGHADAEAQATLKQIASDPVRGYKTVYDAESLRAFFVASMSAGQNI